MCNEDNTFQTYQYDEAKNESFCYDYWGKEIEGSRVEGPGADCTVEPGNISFQMIGGILVDFCILEAGSLSSGFTEKQCVQTGAA